MRIAACARMSGLLASHQSARVISQNELNQENR